MKPAYFVPLILCLTSALFSQSNPVTPIDQTANPKAQVRVLDQYGKLPLSFEANQGQADAGVKFLSRTGGYTLFLSGDEAVLTWSGKAAKKPAPKGASGLGGDTVSLKRYPDAKPNLATAPSVRGGVLRMKLRNANAAAKVTGVDELAGTSNYFIGNDPSKWRTSVPTYGKVKYEGIYSGIDLVYYGNQRQLEYDFIVAPGADPHRIAFDVRGAKRIRRDAKGDLVFKIGEDEIRWHKPVVYQEKEGTRQQIAAHYAITNTNRVGFEVARYDVSRPLYIDPLIYSTYLGGSGDDAGNSIAVDSAGNAYVTGWTSSTNFPTMNPLQPGLLAPENAFVTKLNSTGTALVYSSYLGGSGGDEGRGIAVDSAGNAYVTGFTCSNDFPTKNPLQPNYGGGYPYCGDGFVTEINAAGSALVYSTYLGGSGQEYGTGIAVDSTGNAYVTGVTQSTDFPTMNPLQPALVGVSNAFVTMISAAGSALVYSTYLGGSGSAGGGGIGVDSKGNAYVTGGAGSGFPTTPGAFQTTCCGAFVTKLNSTGTALVYSSYLGGASGRGIAVDTSGNAYVTGTAGASFPVTPGALQMAYGGGLYNAFVSKFNPIGSALVYSTYLGGQLSKRNDWDAGNGIAVDNAGSAYVIGALDHQMAGGYADGRIVFVDKLNPAGSMLISTSYLGTFGFQYYDEGRGIGVDSAGFAYATGFTNSNSFPTKHPFQAACGGCKLYGDAFVSKIDVRMATITALSSSANPSIYGQSVTFTALITSSIGAPPDGETITFMRGGGQILGTGTLSGGTASFTTSTLEVGTPLIKAVYGGDYNFGGSTSKALKQLVNKATTTTTLVSSLNPSSFGQAVAFTASVTPQFSGTVKGSVTFYDGITLLKAVALSGGTAKFTTSTLTAGTHSITATYNGNVDFDGSSASLTQTVN